MKVRIWSAAALAAAVLAGGTSAVALAAPAHHKAAHHKVVHHTAKATLHKGQHVTLVGAGAAKGESLTFALTKTSVASELRNNSDMDYSQYAPPGQDFLVVTMRLVAGAKPVKAANLKLLVKEANGKTVKVNAAAGVSLGSDSYPSKLAPHKAVVESEAFTVPHGSKGLTLDVSLGSGKPAVYTLPKG